MASLDPHTLVLGKKMARHLLRRACFRYTKAQIDQLALLTPAQAMDVLTQNVAPTISLPYDPFPTASPDGFWTESANAATSFTGQGRKAILVSGWWWFNAINNPTIQYKLSHFLTTRFTVAKQNGAGSATEFYDHIRLCLFYAQGNYKHFALKMTRDNSMLDYLNNDSNRKNSPNENYAREFLELFTIGKGPQIGPGNYTNYTENDIVEAAKVLTGFERDGTRNTIDTDTGLPRGNTNFSQHNTSAKVFSSAFNQVQINGATSDAAMETELSQFVDMVFAKIETAKHICRKLYIYFVKGNISPETEQNVIGPLAQKLFADNYELLPALRMLLESKHFYDLDDANADDETIGAIIKSPIQLLSEVCTYLGCSIPDPMAAPSNFYISFWQSFVHNTFLVSANMALFDPENVAGHPAYYQNPEYSKTWISASTLIARYRMGESLLDGKNRIGSNANIFGIIKIAEVLKNNGIVSEPGDPNLLCQELCSALFALEPDLNRVNYFKNSYLLQGLDDAYWETAWSDYTSTNNATVVGPRLKLLLKKLLSAPEVQIF
jgi:uncharacterized protein (DUF1800 family)